MILRFCEFMSNTTGNFAHGFEVVSAKIAGDGGSCPYSSNRSSLRISLDILSHDFQNTVPAPHLIKRKTYLNKNENWNFKQRRVQYQFNKICS